MTKNVPPDLDEIVAAWQTYCASVSDWTDLVMGLEPVMAGCGLMYVLPNPIDRPGEDFAIADMRTIRFAEPHYHPVGTWEFYFVFAGSAVVVVGGLERKVATGDVVVVSPETAHYTIPDQNFVLAAVSSPPFKPETYLPLDCRVPNETVGFDCDQFARLTHQPE